MTQAQASHQASSLPADRPGGFFRRHGAKLVASLIITFGIVYTIRKGGLKLIPDGGDFGHVRWWTLPVYALTFLAMTWFRSVRWRHLLRAIADVPRKRVLAVSCVGFAAILLMPFRLGEIVRPYMIRTRREDRKPGDSAITMTAATSTVVAERIVDGLYLSIVLALALVLVPTIHPLPEKVVGLPITVQQVRGYGYVMLSLFSVLFVTAGVFYFARSWAHRMTLAVFGKVSTKLAEKLAGIAEKFADGLHVFGRAGDAFAFLVDTTLYWGCNALGMWVLMWGSGVTHAGGSAPTFGEACAIMGILGCTILIPGPPGLLGVFQAGIYAGMTMYYPTEIVTGPGAAYVFLIYLSQLVMQIGQAGLGLALERGSLRALEEAEGIVSAPAET